MVFIIINKYTIMLAWCASPVLAIYYFTTGDTECSVISLLIFVVGMFYMVMGYKMGWWPFRSSRRPTYVVAQEVQNPYAQQPQYYQQDPYAQQQPYQQDPYAQQDLYGQQDQGHEQPAYPDPNYREPGQP